MVCGSLRAGRTSCALGAFGAGEPGQGNSRAQLGQGRVSYWDGLSKLGLFVQTGVVCFSKLGLFQQTGMVSENWDCFSRMGLLFSANWD